jgi:hypothetical protein
MRDAKYAARVAVEQAERAQRTCVAMRDPKGASLWQVAASHARDAEAWLCREIHAHPSYWDEELGRAVL